METPKMYEDMGLVAIGQSLIEPEFYFYHKD